MKDSKDLPYSVKKKIGLFAGYYESLTILGARIFDNPIFKRLLLEETGPGNVLETILHRGADIRLLLAIKPLIPAYIALPIAITVTDSVPIIKRICLIWDIRSCPLSFLVSKKRFFLWGIDNLSDNDPTSVQQIRNAVFVKRREFESIDFSIPDPLKEAAPEDWLYERMDLGFGFFCFFDLFKLCAGSDFQNEIILQGYLTITLNKDVERDVDFQGLLEHLLLGSRFRIAKELFCVFHTLYPHDLPKMKQSVIEAGEALTGLVIPTRVSIEWLELVVSLHIKSALFYASIVFRLRKYLVHLLRSQEKETLLAMRYIRCKHIVYDKSFTDLLTDSEFKKVCNAAMGRTVPDSVTVGTNTMGDIETFYRFSSHEKKLQLIKDGTMLYHMDLLIQEMINDKYFDFTYLFAYLDLYNDNCMLFSMPYKIPNFPKAEMEMMADLLIETGHTHATTNFCNESVTVVNGIIFCSNLAIDPNDEDWEYFYHDNLIVCLKIQLAFWNFFKGQEMFFSN